MTGPPDGAPRSVPRRAPRRPAPAFLGWAELSLTLVTLAAVFGFARLFEGWSYIWPLGAVVILAHVVTVVARRLGRGLLFTAGAGLAGFVVLTTWMWFFDTTVAGVPMPDTLRQAGADIQGSWAAFHELQAPVPPQTGLVLASAIALFFAVFLADWAAFRLWSPIEALIPTTTLFVFGAVLGADRHRTVAAVAYCGAVAAFLLLHRLVRIDLSGAWISGQAGAGARSLLLTGAVMATMAVVGGALIGGAGPDLDEPLIDWRADGTKNGPRVTVSPLVDIRSRLVDQSNREVFTVESPQPEYWRMTALDTFDGTIWRSGGKYQQASGALPAEIPPGAQGVTLQQTFTITGLAAIWLPAAFQPVAVDPNGADVRYQPSSATLIVDTDLQSSDDLTYVVESIVPRIDPALLADNPALSLDEDRAELTELPAGFSPDATALAQQVVARAGATSPYEQALALQNFFQDEGTFATDGYEWSYDLTSVDAGHDVAAIDAFLVRQSGYCEQFAGTYAAMARSLGLPARVAVGFTWGDADPDDPNRYTVRGRNAHAWPEVWLGDDVGWIAFEPTPGRGQPGYEEVTGVPPAQDEPEGGTGTTPTTFEPPASTTTEDLSASTTTEAPVPPATPPTSSGSSDGAALTALAGRADPGVPTVVIVAMLAAVALVAMVSAVPLARRAQRQRRRQAATTPNARVDLAWIEALDDLTMAGVARAPSETHREYGQRARIAFPASDAALSELASTSEVGMFAGEGIDESQASRSEAAAEEIHAIVHATVPTWRRLGHALDPRTLRRP